MGNLNQIVSLLKTKMGKFTKFMLACALLSSMANASLYIDSMLTMIDGMFVDASDTSLYVKWGIDLVWYSLAPIVAPIIGGLVTNIFDGTNDISGVPADEALAIAGLHTATYAFDFIMNLIPKIICGTLGGLVSGTCTATFSTTETTLCDLFGFTDCAVI